MARIGKVIMPIVGEVATEELAEWQGKGRKSNPFLNFLSVIGGVKGFQQRKARQEMPKNATKQQQFMHNFISTVLSDDVAQPVQRLRGVVNRIAGESGQKLTNFFKSADEIFGSTKDDIKKVFGDVKDEEVEKYAQAIQKVKGKLDPFRKKVETMQSEQERNRGGNIVTMLKTQDAATQEADVLQKNLIGDPDTFNKMDKYEQAVWLKLRDKANEAGVIGKYEGEQIINDGGRQVINQAGKLTGNPGILEELQGFGQADRKQTTQALEKLSSVASGQGTIQGLANKPNQDFYNKMTWEQFNSGINRYERAPAEMLGNAANKVQQAYSGGIFKRGQNGTITNIDEVLSDIDPTMRGQLAGTINDFDTKWNSFVSGINQNNIKEVGDFDKLWSSTFGEAKYIEGIDSIDKATDMDRVYSFMRNKMFDKQHQGDVTKFVRNGYNPTADDMGIMAKSYINSKFSKPLYEYSRTQVNNDFNKLYKDIDSAIGYRGFDKVKYNALAYSNLAIPIGIGGAITTGVVQSNQGVHKTAYDEFQLGKIYTSQRGY